MPTLFKIILKKENLQHTKAPKQSAKQNKIIYLQSFEQRTNFKTAAAYFPVIINNIPEIKTVWGCKNLNRKEWIIIH